MSKKHSICSASSSHRWLACPGSVAAIIEAKKLGLVQIKSSIYAEEGTRCHAIAELLLNDYLKQAPKRWIDGDEEMKAAARFYVDKVIEEIAKFDAPPDVRVEAILELDQDLSMFGTSDCAITGYVGGEAVGVILDLKYGKTKVTAEHNSQLAFYACAMRKTSKKNLRRVKVIIVQPRIAKSITEVEYSYEDLLAWEMLLKTGAERVVEQLIFKSKRQHIAGDHCKWCDGLAVCPEKNKKPDVNEGLEFLIEGE